VHNKKAGDGMDKQYIAVDLCVESGRVMLGLVSEDKLALEEIHRFSNGPIEEGGSIRWDFNRLLSEIKTGISKAVKAANVRVSSNILMQAKAIGQINTPAELRKIVRSSFELKEYQPQNSGLWNQQYEKILLT
jgi:hypothetical protein